jgi:hypothetical protein
VDQGELSRDPKLNGATFTEQNATHSDYLSFLADEKSAKTSITLSFK